MIATREGLRQLVDVVDDSDINIIYQVLMRFVPEVQPFADEVLAIEEADKSIERLGTVDYADINWD